MIDCEDGASESVIFILIRIGVQLALIPLRILSTCRFVHARNALKKAYLPAMFIVILTLKCPSALNILMACKYLSVVC